MRDCDTLLTVGSNFPYSQFLPEYDQARAVQIDLDGRNLGLRYPYELNLVGDARATLRALIPLLSTPNRRGAKSRSWRKKVEKDVSGWWDTMQREAMVSAEPVNPMRIFHELSERLPSNAIVSADSGSAADWYARQLRFTSGIRGSLSGTLATMGAAVPYAIGAKFAHPDRPATALVGDRAMQMNNLAELITIRRYCEEWADPRLVVAVLHNDDLNQVTWELRAMGGSPKFTASQELPDISYASIDPEMGLEAIEVDKPDDVGTAWDRALAADRPTVFDIRCDPNVPPIPPHVSFEEALNSARALFKGDEDVWAS